MRPSDDVKWREGLAAIAPLAHSERIPLVRALRAQLSPTGLADLANGLQHLAPDECDVALGVLLVGDLPTDPAAEATLHAVVPRLARSCYPSALGQKALLLWRDLDRSASSRFVLNEVSVPESSDHMLKTLAHHVLACGATEAVRMRLEEIGRQGGEGAIEARRLLERAFPSDDRIVALQKAWLANRTANNLAELYYAFMIRSRLRVATKREVLEAFGTPDDSSGPTVWYSPTAGTSLSFHFRDGKLEGSHLT